LNATFGTSASQAIVLDSGSDIFLLSQLAGVEKERKRRKSEG